MTDTLPSFQMLRGRARSRFDRLTAKRSSVEAMSLSNGARPTDAAPSGCPFHDGAATLDLLLAELNPRETELFDAVLDLRSLATAVVEATACAEQLFRVRELLDERHYLAFYRVRCWARRALRIEVRAERNAPWVAREFPLDAARLDEVFNAAMAGIAGAVQTGDTEDTERTTEDTEQDTEGAASSGRDGPWAAQARVRFNGR